MNLVHIIAYLDPNTGSMAYQIAISGFLAALAAGRLYWAKIKRLFARGRAKEPPTGAAPR
jgi:membrane associated rhomboid family serine protease